jgi:hypothetical protein
MSNHFGLFSLEQNKSHALFPIINTIAIPLPFMLFVNPENFPAGAK